MRERATLSLKKPVKEIIIVHRDSAGVLDALDGLKDYIQKELNTKKITFSTDERAWCTLTAVANGKVLGRKLGKAFRNVMKEVKKLSHEDIIAFEEAGSIELAGQTLSTDDIFLNRKVIEKKGFKGAVEGGMVVVLDTSEDKSLLLEGLAREVINRVQKLRKAANISMKDKIQVFYDTKNCDDLKAAIEGNIGMIKETIRTDFIRMQDMPFNAVRIAKLEGEAIGAKGKLDLVISPPFLRFASDDELAAKLGSGISADVLSNVKTYLGSMNYQILMKECESSKEFEFVLDGQKYSLTCGKHFFV